MTFAVTLIAEKREVAVLRGPEREPPESGISVERMSSREIGDKSL